MHAYKACKRRGGFPIKSNDLCRPREETGKCKAIISMHAPSATYQRNAWPVTPGLRDMGQLNRRDNP